MAHSVASDADDDVVVLGFLAASGVLHESERNGSLPLCSSPPFCLHKDMAFLRLVAAAVISAFLLL